MEKLTSHEILTPQVVAGQRHPHLHMSRHTIRLGPCAMPTLRFAFIAALSIAPIFPASAQDSTSLAAQVRALEQRIVALEQQRARVDSTARPQSAQPAGP